MFTGIIESEGRLVSRRAEGSNLILRISTSLDEPIKVDQSIAHNGVCLTVVEIFKNDPQGEKEYSVVAVDETLKKTNLGALPAGGILNVERCLKVGQRMDGHFVQGHVDTTGRVVGMKQLEGSWMYDFAFPTEFKNLLVDKGSICINGVSLTIVHCDDEGFSVTIIPYTFEHTNFKTLVGGDAVNLEFDILGKYLQKIYGDRP